MLSNLDIELYTTQGYLVVENVLKEPILTLARETCNAAVNWKEKQMQDAGINDDGINLLNRRYFISCRKEKYFMERNISNNLDKIIFNELMENICKATIGNTAYLHNEQFVVKYRDEESSFAWHQDSGYSVYKRDGSVGAERHKPYVTCWIALDDMTEENGTISVLPFNRAGNGQLTKHSWSNSEAAMVGYNGSDQGVLIEIPAGSIVCFSSVTLHKSGPNLTSDPRRSYIIQYAPTAFGYEDDPKRRYAPSGGQSFLVDGTRVI